MVAGVDHTCEFGVGRGRKLIWPSRVPFRPMVALSRSRCWADCTTDMSDTEFPTTTPRQTRCCDDQKPRSLRHDRFRTVVRKKWRHIELAGLQIISAAPVIHHAGLHGFT